MTKKDTSAIDSMTYENAFSELEEIIQRLETSQPSLEESLALFERGQLLANHCTQLLEKAELKVRKVMDLTEETSEQEE